MPGRHVLWSQLSPHFGLGGVPGSLVGDVSVVSERLAVQLRPPPRHHARTVVRPRGELVSNRLPRVRTRLLKAIAEIPGVLEVDLDKVAHLGPEASALLLAVAAAARRRGIRFVITRASPRSLRALQEPGIRRLLDTPQHPLSEPPT
ncbi:STAS domain-containing protein [Streptomyces tauricus]|uniref:STAS domain-containing protein n=1 Tax=Streptomyces tauricus TaxID=68274 RepID=UPI00380A7686